MRNTQACTCTSIRALRWHDPPLSGDVSHAALSMIALEAMLCARGFTPAQATYLGVLVRWEALQMTACELSDLPSISASDWTPVPG